MSSHGEVTIIDPASDGRWDLFVSNHSFGWLCHLSAWKKILERSFKQMKGYYLVLLEGDTIKAALPLFEVKSWLTGDRLVSIPFATLCDPLISQIEDFDILFKSAIKLSNELGSHYIEIRTLLSQPLIEDQKYDLIRHYKHHYLRLDSEPEQLKKSFHRKSVRDRITKALKSNLKLKVVGNIIDLNIFYRLFVMTRKRVGLPPQPYIFIKVLWETLVPTNNLTLLLAEYNNRPVAGMILFKFKTRVSVEYAVSDSNYWHVCPNHFLFWEAIKSAYYEGFKIFDFGRTSKYNEGLMDFKGRWGTTVVDLPCIYHPAEVGKKIAMREKSISYRFVRKACNVAPQPLFSMMGKFLYDHMG